MSNGNYITIGEAAYNPHTGELIIATPYPPEEHNCDQWGCTTLGPHVLFRLDLASIRPDLAETLKKPEATP